MRRSGRYSFGDKVANTPYTPAEDRTIMEMVSEGKAWHDIAAKLDRSWRAVETRFSALRKAMGPQAK